MEKKVIRQKTLFDDEISDEKYFKEEIKKRRQREIKEKEKVYIKKYAKSCQISPSEVDKAIERNMKAYDDMLIEVFGDANSVEIFKRSINNYISYKR